MKNTQWPNENTPASLCAIKQLDKSVQQLNRLTNVFAWACAISMAGTFAWIVYLLFHLPH